MSDYSEKDKAQFEIYKSNFDFYRRTEAWGATLFLGAIGLITQQACELNMPSAVAAPIVVGVIAFIMLRIVNYRGCKARSELYEKAGMEVDPPSWGAFGFMLAALPLIVGMLAADMLSYKFAGRHGYDAWSILAWVVLLFGLGFHVWDRRSSSKKDNA